MSVQAVAYNITSFPFVASTVILVCVYLLIVSERVNRAVAAMLGATVLVLMGLLNQEEAIRAVDFNTIGFLIGMMIVVAVARKSGLFEFVAVRAAQIVRASPSGVLFALPLVTAVFSAALDNVTTVLLVVPVTLAICGRLNVPVYPYLFTEILASNIGGTATQIGDPPNIMIGSAVHLSFNDFLFNLAPVVILILAVQILVNHLIWGFRLRASAEDRARIMAHDARHEIKDKRLLTYSVWVIGLLILGFALGEMFHLRAATIALFGGATMLLLDNFHHHRHKHNENILAILNDVEWITIFFFVGLFVVVGGVEKAGLLTYLAGQLTAATGGDLKLTALGILWASAGTSAIIDNIPFVATMIPLIKTMAPSLGGAAQMDPVWWSLALGACLGGNGTLIGASANLVVAGQAEKHGVRFSFVKFTLLAFPMMLMSIVICHFYILWRYF